MTSPIALLLPISGAEPPAPQPTVEDPALFSAALVAALQSAVIPVPTPTSTPTPVPAPPAKSAAPQPEGQGEVPAGDAEAGATPSPARTMSTENAPLARGARERGQRLTAAAAVSRASTPVVTVGPKISVKEAVRLAKAGEAGRLKAIPPVSAVAAIEDPARAEAAVADQGGAVDSAMASEAAPNRTGVTSETKAPVLAGEGAGTAPRETQADASPVAGDGKALRTGMPTARSPESFAAPNSVSPSPKSTTSGQTVGNRRNAKASIEPQLDDAPVVDPSEPDRARTAGAAIPLTSRSVQGAAPVAMAAEPAAPSVGLGSSSEPSPLMPESPAAVAPTVDSRAPVAPDIAVSPDIMVSAALTVTPTRPVPAKPEVHVDAAASSDEATPRPASALDSSTAPQDPDASSAPSPKPHAPDTAPIKTNVLAVPSSAPRSAHGESRGPRRKSTDAAEQTDTTRAPVTLSTATQTPTVPVLAMPPQMVIPKNSSTTAEAEAPRGEPDAAQVPTAGLPTTDAAVPDIPTEPMAAGSGRGLAFAQELAALLGDADITSLRVSTGARERAGSLAKDASQAAEHTAEPARPDAAPMALPEPAPRAAPPARGAPLGVRPEGEPAAMSRAVPTGAATSVIDDDRLAVSGGSSPVPSGAVAGPREPAVAPRTVAYQRRAVTGDDLADGGKAQPSGATRGDAARVRVAEPAPQRAAPPAIPLDEPSHARTSATSRAPILPASRQELPASANRGDDGSSGAAKPDARDKAEPSDSENRASATLPTPTESLGRGEARAKEVVGGEARNMPDRAETKERPAGLADRVTLQVADAEGRETRIRVTVQGDQVRAVILPSDQESARHLERRMDDLQAALVRQGFADPKVSVQAPSTTGSQVTWGAGAGGAQGDNASGRGTDQPAEERGQGSGRQHQERGGDGQRHPQQRFRERDRDDRQNQDA